MNDPLGNPGDTGATGQSRAVPPFAVISGAQVQRALAAGRLSLGRPRPTRVGFVGTGLIARYIHSYLVGTGWSFDEVGVHDLAADSATGFADYLRRSGATGRITVHDEAERLIRESD